MNHLDFIKFNFFFHSKLKQKAIFLDTFLPRVVQLAVSSTHRQTKLNACELLHAICVYMIGKSASAPQQLASSSSSSSTSSASSLYQLARMYNRVYPALFRLACDTDAFARDLFAPLVMQMVHWFTGNRTYESGETIELLNCIMSSVVDEENAALRDFAAKALNEFLKWSIKHMPLASGSSSSTSSSSSSSSSYVNVKSILKRLFSLLTHPSESKRLGAALAWNSGMYATLREEETLVSRHILEILYYFVESLALADTADDRLCGTREHCKQALDHVERIVATKSALLNERHHSDRVKPPGWSEAVLEVAVRWLLRQCGRVQTECRHKCMQLVYRLAPLVVSGSGGSLILFSNLSNYHSPFSGQLS